MRVDHKTTPKSAWPGTRDPISKIWDPLITFERICFKFGTDIDDGTLSGVAKGADALQPRTMSCTAYCY